jgi:hypothetical protein
VWCRSIIVMFGWRSDDGVGQRKCCEEHRAYHYDMHTNKIAPEGFPCLGKAMFLTSHLLRSALSLRPPFCDVSASHTLRIVRDNSLLARQSLIAYREAPFYSRKTSTSKFLCDTTIRTVFRADRFGVILTTSAPVVKCFDVIVLHNQHMYDIRRIRSDVCHAALFNSKCSATLRCSSGDLVLCTELDAWWLKL